MPAQVARGHGIALQLAVSISLTYNRPSEIALRIAVLTRGKSLYCLARFAEAAEGLGHGLRLVDPTFCHLLIANGQPEVHYQGRRLRGVDVAITRLGGTAPDYALAVVHHLELMGVPVVNNFAAIFRARDKMLVLQHLAAVGLRVPRTVMARHAAPIGRAVRTVGGLPVVLKVLHGAQGAGVILADSLSEVRAILEAMWALDQNVLIQEYVADSRGRDLRALVIGGEVVAAMRREAKPGEFRANLHCGGSTYPCQLDPECVDMALRAAQAIGLDIAGVDMMVGRDGPCVLEVNGSPGFEGLEAATGLDIATQILNYAVTVPGRAARPLSVTGGGTMR